MIKIITGLRRSGKSYLLDPMFKNSLLDEGIKEGGVGEKITALLHNKTDAKILSYSINGFIEHGDVDELIDKYAFSEKQIWEDLRKLSCNY